MEIEEKIQIDRSVLNNLAIIKTLGSQAECLKNEVEQLKKSELARINKEFLLNDYARRYGITQEIIVTIISGEDHAREIFINQMKEQRVFLILYYHRII